MSIRRHRPGSSKRRRRIIKGVINARPGTRTKSMQLKPTKGDKQEVRRETHLTRPPRLENAVKESQMLPVRKPKDSARAPENPHKAQGITEQQRKDYQLRSKRH